MTTRPQIDPRGSSTAKCRPCVLIIRATGQYCPTEMPCFHCCGVSTGSRWGALHDREGERRRDGGVGREQRRGRQCAMDCTPCCHRLVLIEADLSRTAGYLSGHAWAVPGWCSFVSLRRKWWLRRSNRGLRGASVPSRRKWTVRYAQCTVHNNKNTVHFALSPSPSSSVPGSSNHHSTDTRHQTFITDRPRHRPQSVLPIHQDTPCRHAACLTIPRRSQRALSLPYLERTDSSLGGHGIPLLPCT